MSGGLATRRLGASGIEVSVLALGTMMFGSWGNPDVAECRRMVDRALDGGITLFDTADIYGEGGSEEILGAALQGRRDRVVLATKCGNPMGSDPASNGVCRRAGCARRATTACAASASSTSTCSRCTARTRRCRWSRRSARSTSWCAPARSAPSARRRSRRRCSTRCSASRSSTASPSRAPSSRRTRSWPAASRPTVLPVCRRADVGVLVWAPLNGGWLTGKYQRSSGDASSRANRKGEHFDHRDEDVRRRKIALVDRLGAVAAECGLTLVQLALAFVLDDPAVSAALIGPRTVEQLDDLLGRGRADASGRGTRGDRRARPARNERQPRRRRLTASAADRAAHVVADLGVGGAHRSRWCSPESVVLTGVGGAHWSGWCALEWVVRTGVGGAHWSGWCPWSR